MRLILDKTIMIKPKILQEPILLFNLSPFIPAKNCKTGTIKENKRVITKSMLKKAPTPPNPSRLPIKAVSEPPKIRTKIAPRKLNELHIISIMLVIFNKGFIFKYGFICVPPIK